ncbi:endoglucanase, putative [Cordyceps militaris CM01]|uniref:Endoglucanase, putative n=2 Tax=Cordyceps militaris TaxID=73501 RepID=G3J857_CORMM|nr:endoglucanase, putative [Cordyceps militaris CM01]ATY60186.1 endoglucanase, putative [Cordyceps militaris]EGX93899.1 endoglucanase, putative [Cordyceps militaris CM01]
MHLPSLSLPAVLGFVSVAAGHMQMSSPAPFRSKHNPYTTNVDYDMINPLAANGANFPCKGYHTLLNTPQGRSVVTWRAGGSYTFSVEGSATHNGGSCQVSLSYDGGNTFTAIQSYIGGCPLKATWPFTLPNDTPAGEAIFAWSWFNNIGNREMYMNCAHVTIQPRVAARDEAEGVSLNERAPSDPFRSRPRMFAANVANGCSTVEGSDVLFPSLGPDVINVSARTAPPRGTCA